MFTLSSNRSHVDKEQPLRMTPGTYCPASGGPGHWAKTGGPGGQAGTVHFFGLVGLAARVVAKYELGCSTHKQLRMLCAIS